MSKKRSLVWPVLLIVVGLVFLLENLDVVDVNLWTIFANFWPLVFVIAGIDMLFFQSGKVGTYISVLLVLGVVALGAWANDTFDGQFEIGETITVPIFHEIDDVDEVIMDIEMGIGELIIDALDMEGVLIDGAITVGENEDITDSILIDSDSVRYALYSEGYNGFSSVDFGRFNNNGDLIWDLDISNALPLDLSISAGVSESTVDLTGLMIEDFSYDGGVGETTITFPGEGTFIAHIDMGIGEMTIYLPESLSVRIIASVGIGDVSVSGNYQTESSGQYVSPGFDSSDGVTLYVDGGIGELDIIQIP